MSYLELREANMARNEEFLMKLGFGIGVINKALPQQSKERSKANKAEEEEADIEIDLRSQKERFAELISHFPHREEQLYAIEGYLDDLFSAAPALHVSGPTGCGKTDICRSAVESRSTPNVYFLCTGYQTVKQFVRSLWGAIVAGCSPTHKSVCGPSSVEENLAKMPTNFSDLASAWRLLMTQGSTRLATVNVVLDRVDVAESLETRLTSKLLHLHEFVHPGIKVIAISSRLPTLSQTCMMVQFQAYSIMQLEHVLCARLCAEEASPPERSVASVLSVALPHLSSFTLHVGELLMAIRFVLAKVKPKLIQYHQGSGQGNILGSSAQMPSVLRDAVVDATKESARMPSANIKVSGMDSADGQLKRSSPRSGSSDIPPGWTALSSLSQVVDPASLRSRGCFAEMAKSRKYLLIAAYLASRNPKESDSIVFALSKRGRRSKVQAGKTGDEAERKEEARGQRPFSLERLLSIFSQISIIGETSAIGSKRKRVTNSKEARSSFDVAAAIDRHFGDAQLFAAINDLESQRYLIRSSSWTLDCPSYFSAIPNDMAMELSVLLSFDLGTYLHSGRS
jgi:hypothetical protein